MDSAKYKKRIITWPWPMSGIQMGSIINTTSSKDEDEQAKYWYALWPEIVGPKSDIKPPGVKIAEKLDNETKHRLFDVFGYPKPKQPEGGPKDPNCFIHEWTRYEGLLHDYDFCTKCDLKRDIKDK